MPLTWTPGTMALCFDLAGKAIGTVDSEMTAAYSDLVTDTVYGVVGTQTIPMLRGATMTGDWRSRLVVDNSHPGFGWLRVGGDFTGDALVNIYRDGVLHASVSVTQDEPTRIPAGRGREWEVECLADGAITRVTLTTTMDEMKAAR